MQVLPEKGLSLYAGLTFKSWVAVSGIQPLRM